MNNDNPLKMRGIEFTEFVSSENEFMDKVFLEFGFSKLKKHTEKEILFYNQNNIHFLLNYEKKRVLK